ncbi:MFS transporter [Marinimicrobium alkaliphilum]|uniref:MFS transporter n=1 Tax=Marinimicrobium alkaliphilum TaxID=2202654 RepID=UPI0018E07C41|nr:MFS transporter [Marinimicrobium alkaliphilum]
MALPYWRLSGFYFFYFAVLGALIPYWGLYLKSLGYSSQEIGMIGALIMGTKIVGPNFWGWVADRTGERLRYIRLGAFLSCVFFAGLFIRQDFLWVALVVTCYTFFWNAIQAQFEVLTLGHLGRDYERYSRIRLWGSVGFIVAVVGLGWVFDWLPIDTLPIFLLTFLLLIWGSSLTVGERAHTVRESGHAEAAGSFARQLLSRPVLCFYGLIFLLQLSHGPYYTFYSLYLVEQYGYTRTATGLLWGLGVLAEVGIFMVMHRLLMRFSVRQLLLASLVLTAARWLMIGFWAHSLSLLILAQLLHAFSFAVAHAAGVEWVRRQFGGRHHGQGQALYSAMSFGAGGSAGALISGMLWDVGATLTFVIAAGAALAGFLLAWWGLRNPVRSDS